MLRTLFAIILLVHGIVQAFGFLKEFNLDKVMEISHQTLFPFSKTTSKVIGILWMVSAILFIGTAFFFLLQIAWWWMVAIGAILVSQFLVIVHWENAKFSTLFNVVLLAVLLPSMVRWTEAHSIDFDF